MLKNIKGVHQKVQAARQASKAAGKPLASSEHQIKEGLLKKRGASQLGLRWKQRYFVLTKTVLQYYKSSSDPYPQGEIPITASTSVETSPDLPTHLHISNPATGNDRVYRLDAETPSNRDEWAEAIKTCVAFNGSTLSPKGHCRLDSRDLFTSDLSALSASVALGEQSEDDFFTTSRPSDNPLVVSPLSTHTLLADRSHAAEDMAVPVPDHQVDPTLFSSLGEDWNLAMAQTKGGLHTLKRVCTVLQKVVVIEQKSGAELGGVMMHEASKSHHLGLEDGMRGACHMWASVQSSWMQVAASRERLSREMATKVVQPLVHLHALLKSQYKSLKLEQRECEARLDKLVSSALGEKLKTLRMLKEAQSNRTRDGADVRKAYVQALAYENAVKEANATRDEILRESFPKIVCGFQNIEERRLAGLQARLEEYHSMVGRESSLFTTAHAAALAAMEAMSVQQDMDSFVRRTTHKALFRRSRSSTQKP
eukprot:CAMPEP_0175173982 /NCGR_PEP_ID=MMETSP0087-20121206/32368_1 /TAXON_ID=136419 /ORGANISM="Unknown Unknown, Strain D1" /LENGTH=480 /DNA_ID=CAMNT_0016465379 /DNA_START=18 /DNA_END=1456 /DNA_ORIENTATION=-